VSLEPLIVSLTAALEDRPEDLPLRLHLAGLLLDAGRLGSAIEQVAQVLARDPDNAQAQALMQRALCGPTTGSTGDASGG